MTFEEQVREALGDIVEQVGRAHFVANPYDSPPRVPLLKALAPRVIEAWDTAKQRLAIAARDGSLPLFKLLEVADAEFLRALRVEGSGT